MSIIQDDGTRDPKGIEYLALEGGGGKGFAFLGTLQYLEQGDVDVLPLHREGRENQILGIAGASAGAITALLIALGFGSEEVEQQIADRSILESFMDEAQPGVMRHVSDEYVEGRGLIITSANDPYAEMLPRPTIDLEALGRAVTGVAFVGKAPVIPSVSLMLFTILLELKRGCQTILTGQDFDLFGALTFAEGEVPRIDRLQAIPEGEFIQFFEDCFEWENMTYLFYPYHWAGRARWAELLARSSTAMLHQAFLQSGAARVVVPVREGYERAVGSYLASSVVPTWHPAPWRGGQSPYPPIDDLIADANDRPGDEVAIGEPWEVVTPTSLVYLQVGSDLNPVSTIRKPGSGKARFDSPAHALSQSS